MPTTDAHDRTSPTPPAVVHVDVDGFVDVCAGHGWPYPWPDDPLFRTGLEGMLELFDETDVRATFFVVANSLDDPAKARLLAEVSARGHEIASHTLSHRILTGEDTASKRREILDSRTRLESELGAEVRGFRAPGYMMDRECMSLLDEGGYVWDSSAFPTSAFSGRLEVPVERLCSPGRPYSDLDIVEFPLPDHRPSPFPTTPSYAHLFGATYFRWSVRRAARREVPFVLLFHLVDTSEPLPDAYLPDWKARLYTLSNRSASGKRAACRRMIGTVREYFELTTTDALLAAVPAAGAERS